MGRRNRQSDRKRRPWEWKIVMKAKNCHSISTLVGITFNFAAVFLAAAGNTPDNPAAGLTNTSQIPPDTAYHVVARDADSRVWERTVWERSADGKWTPKTHRYTELATGLNYRRNGQWVESKARIDLLPDGRAAATQGQHPTYFPADIYQGVIETVTAEGRHLTSRPLGVSYGDGTNTVLIGELKDSVGQLVGANQVLYPDAFTGIKADLRYTYTLAGIEQDIILREQPPAPDALGLSAATARLQMLTEFLGTNEPVAAERFADRQHGLTDHELAFGTLRLIQGRAFSLTENSPGTGPEPGVEDAPVFKSWQHQAGRSYLVEELPWSEIRGALGRLPAPAMPAALTRRTDPVLGKLAAGRLLPDAPKLGGGGQGVRIARGDAPAEPGYVLDYFAISYTYQPNGFTFRGDTTYFLSNAYFADSGVDVIEGGTVIKFDNNTANINLLGPSVSCQTGPYRPAILTAKDDDSVGETISGSTGNPTGLYGSANFAVNISYYNENLQLHDLRMSWLRTGVQLSVNSDKLANIQVVNCGIGFKLLWSALVLNNGLFDNVGVPVASCGGSPAITGSFLTVHNCASFATGVPSQISLANCLLVNATNFAAGTGAVLVTNNVAVLNSDAGVFQTVGAGAHYLAAGSPWRGAGTTNVSPAILAAMAARTTWPPTVLAGVTYAAPAGLTIQAPRNNGAPDLGYHYDPLDYITDAVLVNQTALTLANGVAVACYNRPGITLQNGGSITSVGTPGQPNWFARYQSVQEQSVSLGGAAPESGQNVVATWSAANPPAGTFLFSHFATPANGGAHFTSAGAGAYGRLTVQNGELWGGTNDFSGAGGASTTAIINNLFYRTTLLAANASAQTVLSLSNNLLLESVVTLNQPAGGAWTFFDNAVDTSDLATNSVINSGFNAYLNCPYALPGTGNLILTNSLNYQAGPLGNYYQPANSPLIDAGSVPANQAGYFHFTTQTTQAKETNSVLDIGYHYVAVDANGNPFDNNGDGIPDYLEDANGDGIPDKGETPWLSPPVFVAQPAPNQILFPGSNVVFSVTVTGLDLTLQWYGNAGALAGQTNSVLAINDVQPGNAGDYYAVATNYGGSVTSSNSLLALLTPPVIAAQPASQTVLQTFPATFSVSATGLFLNYQWYSNSIPVPGATNATLTVATFATNAPVGYKVVVSNTAGAVTSATATLTVQGITSQPVIYAASGNFGDVSKAVAGASPGSVVLIPPGTYSWTQTLYLNGVSLRGCGTNQTIILMSVPPTSNNGILIDMNGATNGLTELSNFQIQGDPNDWTTTYSGIIIAAGSSNTPWRIDHMFFNGLYSKGITTYGNAMSVIDHNAFVLNTIAITTASYGDQYASYSLPPTYGLNSSNVLYMEDNYFNDPYGVAQVCDGYSGSRSVLRYNTIWNGDCGNHGTETGGNLRSQRSMEIYGNNFTYYPGVTNMYLQFFTMCFFRGGSAVIFSNTASGYESLIAIRNFRNTDTFSGQWEPYGGANGLNPWDDNNPAVQLQGVHSGPAGAGYLQVAGANWTVNQWVGYTLDNTNSGLFSEVISNNANTMYYLGLGIVHNNLMTFNPGDGFAVYQVNAALDQPGRGSGDLMQANGSDSNGNMIVINTTTGTPSWPHQVIEPLYFWGNILNGQPAEAASPYPTIQLGRDFFNDTPKPGYTPFQYPHPLTLINVH